MAPPSCEGGCLCGDVRYRVTAVPRSHGICFCRTCRLSNAAGSVAWFVIAPSQFEILAGELKAFRSSAQVMRSFCPRCGTAVAYAHAQNPAEIEITTATLDDPERWRPEREVWLSQRVTWALSDPALAHYPRASADDPQQ